MTCINVRAKAEDLGVSLEDVVEGHRKIADYCVAHKDLPIRQCRIDAIKMLPEREAVAVIRMDELDVHLPELFTKDGVRS